MVIHGNSLVFENGKGKYIIIIKWCKGFYYVFIYEGFMEKMMLSFRACARRGILLVLIIPITRNAL